MHKTHSGTHTDTHLDRHIFIIGYQMCPLMGLITEWDKGITKQVTNGQIFSFHNLTQRLINFIIFT
jgi:hypothetical protein